jgi:hypothetical protein
MSCDDAIHEVGNSKTIEADINDLASGWILIPSYLPRSGGGRPSQQLQFLVEKEIQITSSPKRSP